MSGLTEQLFELPDGLLGLIIEYLRLGDRARLALTCRAGRQAALTAPVQHQLYARRDEDLASFNLWLSRRSPAGTAAVCVSLASDKHGCAVATACHLAHCGTKSLSLSDPCPALLEAACTIGSLITLELSCFTVPRCSLHPLGALRQLQQLWLEFHECQAAAPPAWQLNLPALVHLDLMGAVPCSISLDGCSALREVEVCRGKGLVLAASRPLPQLAQLKLWCPNDLAVPWQHLAGLRELELVGGNGAGLLAGATQLAALRSLHIDCSARFVVPPGAWLAGITRLVLEGFAVGEGPEHLSWAASTTGIEELILWVKSHPRFPDPEHLEAALKWVRWAAGLERLHLMELREGGEIEVEESYVIYSVARAEGEHVGAMLGRLEKELAMALAEFLDEAY